MRILLTLVLAMVCGTMQAAIFQNTFTTNQNSMGTAALVSQSNNLLGVNNTDTNTFLRSGGTGSAPYFSVLPGSSATNPVPNIYVTNLFATNVTIQNNLTVSNITVTNITVQNNLTVSNLYSVNGNHATLIVTNAVRMPWVTQTLTGTNVAQIDLNAGSMFRVYLAANAYFGTVANHPGTNTSQTIQIALIQDGTGSRTVTMTNSTWFLNGSGATTNAMPTLNSNANALTVLSFVTHPTNSVALIGVPATISP